MSKSTAKIHTTACGVEPYDKSFGVGARKHLDYGGDSPYERIEKLRKTYKATQLTLDSKRVLVFTEVYKNNESQPVVIRKALALKKYMEECKLSYIEGELLMTDDGSPVYANPIYPENSQWYYDELKHKPMYEREWDPIFYDEKTKDEILSTEDYWKGKDIANTFRARVPQDAAKGCAACGGMLVINPNVNVEYGIGHMTPNFPYALEKGIGGMKADVLACKEKLGLPANAEEEKSLQLYEAQLIVLDGFSEFFKRYAAFAKEQIGNYSSQQTKEELQRLSEICEYLAEGAPRNFWEAIQLAFAVCMVAFIESNGHALSLGRMDQYLYPFYRADMEKGAITKDFVQQLIECFYLKMETHGQLLPDAGDGMWRGGARGWSGSALIVGGVDADGNDATNDLSFMLIDATIHTRLANPYLAVRYHEGTPYELKVKVAEAVRLGIGHPKILNDKIAIEALERYGVPEKDARDYVNVGCVELDIPGKCGGWADACYVSLPKVLELALNNGRCLQCAGEHCPNYNTCCRGVGKSLGLQTGYLKDFKTFDEVIAAYEAQLKYWADRAILTVNVLQDVSMERDEYPFMSTVISDCTEKGKGFVHGGARYNAVGLQALGPATTADSLTALKKLVYEDKKVTPEEYYDALLRNWEGHERLYQLVNSEKIPHYGNDEDYADEMMEYVFDTYCNTLQSYPPSCGIYKIRTGSFSQIINLIFGLGVGATPDGRMAHEAISANIDPARTVVMNRDRNGPTALARSIGKLDHAKAGSGTLINMKFGVDTISGERGRDDFIDFLDAYLAQGAYHIQFMVTNRDTLIDAQKNPDEYKDLLVRVSGFSAYFNSLSTAFQNELINRTEQSF